MPYFYQHVEGPIIEKPALVVESDPCYFDSPFVLEYWYEADLLRPLNTPAPEQWPSEPSKAWGTAPINYRGWECSWDGEAASWGMEGWRAAKGGWDLDCRQTSGRTWTALLREIDAEEETE